MSAGVGSRECGATEMYTVVQKSYDRKRRGRYAWQRTKPQPRKKWEKELEGQRVWQGVKVSESQKDEDELRPVYLSYNSPTLFQESCPRVRGADRENFLKHNNC